MALDDVLAKIDAAHAGGKAAPKDPEVAKASKSLHSVLAKIDQYGSAGEKAKAEGTANQKGSKKNLFLKALSVVDLPRAAVVSAVNETGRMLTQGEVSPGHWLKGVENHIGVGDIVESVAPHANPWVKRGVGLAGDVALDPLTYIAPETKGLKAAEVGDDLLRLAAEHLETGLGKQIAEKGAEKFPELAAEAGRKSAKHAAKMEAIRAAVEEAAKAEGVGVAEKAAEIGAKLREAGTFRGLSQDELRSLGLSNRVGFHIPGTGESVALPGGDTNEAINQLLGKPRTAMGKAWRDTKVAQKLHGAIGTEGALKDVLRSGDADKALMARRSLDFIREGAGAGKKLEGDLASEMRSIIKELKKSGVTLGEAQAAVEDPAVLGAARPEVQAGAERLRGWYQMARDRANEAAGKPFLKDFGDHYVVRHLSPEARDLFSKGGQGGAGFSKIASEFRRLRPGDEFMGEVLKTASTDEIESVIRKHVPEEVLPALFSKNHATSLATYIAMVSKRAGKLRAANLAEQAGLLSDRYVPDLLKISDQWAKATGKREQAGQILADIINLWQERQNVAGADAAAKGANAEAKSAGQEAKLAASLAEAMGEKADTEFLKTDFTTPMDDRFVAGPPTPATAPDAAMLDRAPMPMPAAAPETPLAAPETADRAKAMGVPAPEAPAATEGLNTGVDAIQEAAGIKGMFTGEDWRQMLPSDALHAHADDVARFEEMASDWKTLSPADRADFGRLVADLQDVFTDQHARAGALDGIEHIGRNLEVVRSQTIENVNRIQAESQDKLKRLFAIKKTLTADAFAKRVTKIQEETQTSIERTLTEGHGAADEMVRDLDREIEKGVKRVQAGLENVRTEGPTDAELKKIEARAQAQAPTAEAPTAPSSALVPLGDQAPQDRLRFMSQPERDIAFQRARFMRVDSIAEDAARASDGAFRALKDAQAAAEDASVLYENAMDQAVSANNAARRNMGRKAAGSFKQAEAFYRSASQTQDMGAKAMYGLLGEASEMEGRLAFMRRTDLTNKEALRYLRDRPELIVDLYTSGMAQPGWKALGEDKMGWEHLVDWLDRSSKLVGNSDGARQLLKFYDQSLGVWKAYALLSPGFHFRNLFGGLSNMWLDDVTVKDVAAAARVLRGRGSEEELRAFQSLKDVGLIDGGQSAYEVAQSVTGNNFNPASQHNYVLQGNRHLGGMVENLLRTTHGMAVLRRGGSVNDAMETIYKFHFNYDDLSNFERGYARRIIPFWTFTSRNLPLQLELAITRPAQIKRYLDVKRNIENGTPIEDIVPSYFGEGAGIHLPFKAGGSDTYVLPDLPFVQTWQKATDPGEMLGQLTPVIKTPLEYHFGKQVFNDIPLTDDLQPVPIAWAPLIPILAAANKVTKRSDGTWAIRQKDAYLVEQFNPVLGKLRRQAPSEKKYQDRMLTSWASFMFGLGLRTNGPQDQMSELKRRTAALNSRYKDLQALGYAPKKGQS